MTARAAVAGVALLVFAALLGWAIAAEPTAAWVARADAAVAAWVRTSRSAGLTLMVAELSALGAPVVVNLAVVATIAMLVLLGDASAAWRLAAAGLAAAASSRLAKAFFGRARPEDLPALAEAHGFSYPSGHTLGAALLYLSLALLARRALADRPAAAAGALALGIAAVALVGATRVYLGVHYPSDVLGGAAIGAAWALLLAGAAAPRARRASGSGRAVS